MDVWWAYIKAAESHLPDAAIVHDRFHISQDLNQAIDKVRWQEHKVLSSQRDAPPEAEQISLADGL